MENVIPYSAEALIAVCIFAFVHLWADRASLLDAKTHGRLLSMGGGVAIAYVFVDLLPKLCENDQLVRAALLGIFPYFERHVYVMALSSFILFFMIDRSQSTLREKESFWLSLISYSIFNFFVGYAVVDPYDPEVKPLGLFTFAMSLHYFVNDYSLNESHGELYRKFGKWVLIVSLFLGWIVGYLFTLSATGVALISAFIGGGVIMNVTRHELPKENPHSTGAFLFGVVFYTIVLLSIGQ